MSQRLGSFCDFQCNKPAVGTCLLCKNDYCAKHSISDRALCVSVALLTRIAGSQQTGKTVEKTATAPMCRSCSDSYIKAGPTAGEAVATTVTRIAAETIAAKLSELALKAETETRKA